MAIPTLFYPPKLSIPHRPTRQVSSSTPHSKTQTQVQIRTRNSINHGTIQNPKTTMAAALLGAGLTLTLVGPTSAAELPSLLLLDSTSLQLSEPTNALSLPTWAIHVSSVVEWYSSLLAVVAFNFVYFFLILISMNLVGQKMMEKKKGVYVNVLRFVFFVVSFLKMN